MNYHRFSSEEFAADAYFQQWVLQPNESAAVYWENWLQRHPGKREVIEEARELVLMLGYREEKLPHERIANIRAKLFTQIRQNKKKAFFSGWWKAAAVWTGLALTLAGVLWMLHFHQTVTYATDYKEVREFVLPDSSVITLNANSELSYDDFWSAQGAREVWIRGEAFFKISKIDTLHIADHLKRYTSFIVHTEEMDIAVLGTQFNVRARKEKTSVTLNAGKVALHLNTLKKEDVMILQPGDQVTYDPQVDELTRSQVEPERYSAWRFKQLIFDKVTLQEVASTIKDYYGITVKFDNQELAQREFVGSVTSDHVDALITAIARLYNLKVVKKGDTILFQE